MAEVTVVLQVRPDSAADLARSALSVQHQLMGDWRLRIVHGGDASVAAAVNVLAAGDPRIAGVRDFADALHPPVGRCVAFLETGARYPADYLAAVLSAMADPDVRCTVAGRIVEHGARFAQTTQVPPADDAVASQVAVRREDAALPLPQLLALPGRRDLTDVAVTTRFGEPPPPGEAQAPGLAVIVELSAASPPLSVKPQVAELAAAGLPVVVAVSGPVRAARAALGRVLGHPGVRLVAAPTPAAARSAALAEVDSAVVTFLPAGWEVDPGRLSGLAELLLAREAAAVVPLALDAGGSILGTGLVWADAGSLPQRLLAGHPAADAAGRLIAVPSPHPEGVMLRVSDAAQAADVPVPWWPLVALHRAARTGQVLVDGRCTVAVPRFTPHAKPPVPTASQAAEILAAAPVDAVAASRLAMAELGWSCVGVQAGGGGWRAMVSRPVRTEPVTARRWALKIGAPPGRRGDPWGDVFFADDLAAALRSLGQDVVIDRDGSAGRASAYLDRVVLNVRGYQEVPRQPGAVNLLWIISHPDDIGADEMRRYDRVYAASPSWPATVAQTHGVPVVPLLQATNPERFHPGVAAPDTGPDLLFVGNSRHQFRPIVADCRAAGLHPTVIGRDWEKFLPAEEIAALSVPNRELPAAYRSAGIVLNDHWGDMIAHGFLNNRLFDAVACGARVVSDDVPGLAEVFGDSVAVYRSASDLAELCDPARRGAFGTDEERRRRADRIAEEHSFVARARQLVAEAAQFEILPG